MTETEAFAALDGLRRRYHDARHHCWAYALPPAMKPLERSDDDGEPSQTAGPPILQAIRGASVCGLIVVVTRYFGGVKLGAGGLVRAYGEAAREALAACPRLEHWIENRIIVEVSYEDLGAVEAFLAQHAPELRAVDRIFEGEARFDLVVARSRTDDIVAGLRERTAARARMRVEEIEG